MGATVWILLLSAVPAVFSWPNEEPKWTPTAKPHDSIKTLRMSTESCRQLSETFGTMAKNFVTIPNSMFTDVSPEIMEEEMGKIIKKVFGFDIVNDHQAREKYMCDITTIWMRVTHKSTSDTPLVAFIDAMESSGLMYLDQSRVQWLSQLGKLESYWPIIFPAPFSKMPGSLSAKCGDITRKFMALIPDTLHLPKYQTLISKILETTGLDVTDRYSMGIFICDLTDGATNGVPGLYEVFQSHGIIWIALKAAYPYIQLYEPIWREQLEIMIQRNTIKPMPWHIFGSKYVPYYPRTYKFLGQYLDSTDPVQTRHGLKYDEALPLDPRQMMLTEVVQTVVDFLLKLEASNLLRLPVDFLKTTINGPIIPCR